VCVLAELVSASFEFVDGQLRRLQRHAAERHEASRMRANSARQVVVQQTTQVLRVRRLRLRTVPLLHKQSIDISCPPGPQQQTCRTLLQRANGTDRRTDAQTDGHRTVS